jgi:hypothetical protein
MLAIRSSYINSFFDFSWLYKVKALFGELGKLHYAPDKNDGSGADGSLKIA